MEADIRPGPGQGSNLSDLILFDNKIYFSADHDGLFGKELWSFDGSAANMAAEFNTTPGSFTDMGWFGVFAY